AIQKSNSLANPNRIYVGQLLTIGGKASGTSSSTTPAKAQAPKASSTSGKRHVVVSGETLSSIALKYGTTPGAIQKSNSLANPNRIYVGQVLSIGGKASSSSSSSSSSSNSVGNTFLHYTYSESTTSAANANKDKLVAGKAPSKAQMQQIIRDTAVSMGVDPSLALAHAQVESGFDQRAVSPANAIGAMQVIPSSGEWASSLVGRNLNLLDPYDNATAGVAIIKQLQATASSKDQGIAAYYQGLAGVRKNGMYPDTKNYVAKVKAAQANY
ncbi:lytic transglycosylase, partial [Ancrocorticia sp.]|uniref:lytic transglycosylase n=1 Tax=Ancrocorticia sp. TaxID=2593684 RepID=UPI003F9301EC